MDKFIKTNTTEKERNEKQTTKKHDLCMYRKTGALYYRICPHITQ